MTQAVKSARRGKTKRPKHVDAKRLLALYLLDFVEVADRLGMKGERRQRFLAIVAPELEVWADHDDDDPLKIGLPRQIAESALLDRLERALDDSFTLEDLHWAARKVAPHLFPERAGRPTQHRPGTEGKVQMMIGRMERGEELFHDEDGGVDRTAVLARWAALAGDRPPPQDGGDGGEDRD